MRLHASGGRGSLPSSVRSPCGRLTARHPSSPRSFVQATRALRLAHKTPSEPVLRLADGRSPAHRAPAVSRPRDSAATIARQAPTTGSRRPSSPAGTSSAAGDHQAAAGSRTSGLPRAEVNVARRRPGRGPGSPGCRLRHASMRRGRGSFAVQEAGRRSGGQWCAQQPAGRPARSASTSRPSTSSNVADPIEQQAAVHDVDGSRRERPPCAGSPSKGVAQLGPGGHPPPLVTSLSSSIIVRGHLVAARPASAARSRSPGAVAQPALHHGDGPPPGPVLLPRSRSRTG